MPVTEIGRMTVRPGVDVMDEATREGQVVIKAWKAVVGDKTGPYRMSWGLEVENPANFWAFFDWASVEDHERFANELGGGIVKDFNQVFEPGFTKHIDTKPYPPSALKSPVTEIMLAFFPPDISEQGKAAVNNRVAQFTEKGLNQCADVQAVNCGWGVENDFPVRGGDEGQKGNMLIMLVGWPSIGAHMKFRETEAFKDSVGLLRGMEGMIKLTMFHVDCRSMENESRNE